MSERKDLDSSSFHVDGQYETKEEEAGVVKVTYGYSRDHRPDLKQFVMNLICVEIKFDVKPLSAIA